MSKKGSTIQKHLLALKGLSDPNLDVVEIALQSLVKDEALSQRGSHNRNFLKVIQQLSQASIQGDFMKVDRHLINDIKSSPEKSEFQIFIKQLLVHFSENYDHRKALAQWFQSSLYHLPQGGYDQQFSQLMRFVAEPFEYLGLPPAFFTEISRRSGNDQLRISSDLEYFLSKNRTRHGLIQLTKNLFHNEKSVREGCFIWALQHREFTEKDPSLWSNSFQMSQEEGYFHADEVAAIMKQHNLQPSPWLNMKAPEGAKEKSEVPQCVRALKQPPAH